MIWNWNFQTGLIFYLLKFLCVRDSLMKVYFIAVLPVETFGIWMGVKKYFFYLLRT